MTYQYQDLEVQLQLGDLILIVSEALGSLSGIGHLDHIDPNYITIRPVSSEEMEWLNTELDRLEIEDVRLSSVVWPVIIPIETIKLISVIKRHEPSNKEKEDNNEHRTTRRPTAKRTPKNTKPDNELKIQETDKSS